MELFLVFAILCFYRLLYWLVPEVCQRLSKRQSVNLAAERKLADDMASMRRQMAGMSMMDEFAKCARLQRQLDAAAAKQQELAAARRTFASAVSTALLWLHVPAMLLIVCYYRSSVLVRVPSEWFYPLNAVVAFPLSCPLGGCVGITAWLFACNRVLARLMGP